MHKLHGGGIDRASRRICVISVALTELPTDTKCQFSAKLPCFRLHFSGNNAQIATNAVTTATFTTFGIAKLQKPYP